MSCDHNQRKVTRTAIRKSGISEQSSNGTTGVNKARDPVTKEAGSDKSTSTPQLLDPLASLKALKATQLIISHNAAVRLLGMTAGEDFMESPSLRIRFGEQAKLAVGKNCLAVIADAGESRCSVREIFVTPPPFDDSREEITPTDRNVQQLGVLKETCKPISQGEVSRLFGLGSSQTLDNPPPSISKRFGESARLVMGKDAMGVVVRGGNDRYTVAEVFVPAEKPKKAPLVPLQYRDHRATMGRLAASTRCRIANIIESLHK